MKLLISLLLVAFISPLNVMADPCNPKHLLKYVLGMNDKTNEWLAKNFQYNDVKKFNEELYTKSRNEFEGLKITDQFPKQPPADEFERTMAWLDVQGPSTKLPTLFEVMENGSESQKLRLKEWIDAYSNRKLTEYQTQEAATELSLILNDTRYNISELYRHGNKVMAEKMVTSQYHQKLLEKQLLFTLHEEGLLKKENILNVLTRLRDQGATKWILSGASNAYSLASARKWRHVLLFTLPNHQFAKLTISDLEILLKTGGVDSPHFALIASKYKNKVSFQAFYNSTQSLITQITRIIWVDFGIRKFKQFKERKEKLNTKDHS